MGSGRDVTRQWKARPERLAVVPTIGVRGRGFCIPFAYSSAACLCAWAPGADRAETSKCFPGTCPIQHRQLPMGQPSTSLSGRRLRLPLRIRTGRGRDAQSLLRRRLQPSPHQNSLFALPSLYGVCLPRQTPRAFSISPPPPLHHCRFPSLLFPHSILGLCMSPVARVFGTKRLYPQHSSADADTRYRFVYGTYLVLEVPVRASSGYTSS